MINNPDSEVQWPSLNERANKEIKPKWEWKRKPKYSRPVHEIDPHDTELDSEEIFHD